LYYSYLRVGLMVRPEVDLCAGASYDASPPTAPSATTPERRTRFAFVARFCEALCLPNWVVVEGFLVLRSSALRARLASFFAFFSAASARRLAPLSACCSLSFLLRSLFNSQSSFAVYFLSRSPSSSRALILSRYCASATFLGEEKNAPP
jgi:hypothetical protein